MGLSRYKKGFKGDLLGGLTAAIIALPMGLAFGIQSGMGAEAGLYTAIILSLVAAILGGTQTLISDPTGPMTIVAASIIFIATRDLPADVAPTLILVTFLLAGIFQVSFGYLNIAKYIKFMPYPVISGFMGGIGVIIIILQISPIMGLPTPKGMINILISSVSSFGQANIPSILLGIGSIATIYLLPRVVKKIPPVLFVLIIGTLISLFLPMDIMRVGEIPSSLPTLKWEILSNIQFSYLHLAVVPAVTLAALGTIDTLLTSVVADNLTNTKHKGNKELFGQGLGNIAVALFGGIPGAGATMGTVTNINAGGTTNLSGIFKGVFLMVLILALGQYAAYIPISVLSGILVTVGAGIIDVKGIKLLLKVPRAEAMILIVTLLVTVFDTLLNAVALGAVLSIVFFMKKMSEVVNELNKEGELEEFMKDIELPEELQHKVYVISLDGPLFFGFADQFRDHIHAIKDVSAVIIRLKKVPFMDETGLITIEETIKEFRTKNIEVYITEANDAIYYQLEKVGVAKGLITENHFFPYFSYCVKYIKHRESNVH